MNVFQLNSFYRSLSPEEKELIANKKIHTTLSVRHWFGLLRRVAKYDEHCDAARKSLFNLMIGTGIVMFIALFLTNLLLFYTLYILIAGALLMIWTGVTRARLRKKDLANYLRSFLLPLLVVLKDKAGNKAKVALQLDFTPAMKTELKNKFKHGGRTTSQYMPLYIDAKVVLKDGTLLAFTVGDDYRKLRVVKTNARGKTKVKHKYKITHLLLIRLGLPKEYYNLNSTTPEGIVYEEREEVYLAKARGKFKSQEQDATLSLGDFLKLLERMFEGVERKAGISRPEADDDDADLEAATHHRGDGDDGYDSADAAIPFMEWHGSYFHGHDYDNFNYDYEPAGAGTDLDGDSGGFYDS